jgi:hypothetical protein
VDPGTLKLSGKATRSTVTGPNPLSSNEPGKAPNVVLTEEAFTPDGFRFDLPAWSISLYRMELK